MNELDIFSAAMEITSPERRDEYLEQVCGDNVELRDRIEELLRSHDRIGNFMDSPAPELAGTESMHPIAERAGTMIGPYKLLQEIGEGGMGVVYMAEQTAPVERRVALKIIKPGMDSRQVIARFEAERQALAMMDHPNIAKVLEAGTTDSGRPYFVMELVKGIPITKYCDEHQLTPRERLALFIPVCRAVQHAHQKGIIHRDLKPSNVLVAEYDHERMSKIIDFGVAKALNQRLTEKTMFTQFGQIVGTLEYMSPEQAKLNQLDIDTRSDIYSLGVLLYELLTGSTPFDPQRLRSPGFEEIMRIIREEDPPKPSTRLRTSATLPSVAADRHTEPNKLPGLISGELDWIVMKALEKHRERRYETAGGFAEDVQRYLNDEPVVACPPSVGYKIRKFARKHCAAIAVSSALFTILLAAALVSTWEAMKATKAEGRAREALAEARAAQETEAEARLQAETERNRARQAEVEATQQRDNARQAEQRATADQARAIVSHERAQDALAASLFEQARALRLSGEPGRRWHAIELLQQAEQLRGRQRPAISDAAAEPDESAITKEIPNRSQLRTEAVAALSLRDGRVLRQRSTDDVESAVIPVVYAVSPEGQFAVSVSHRLGQRTGGLVVVDLNSGGEVARWEELDEMAFSGSALALGPGGKRLAAPLPGFQYVTVWELADKRQIHKLKVWTKPGEARSPSESAILPGTIDRMVFSPDGRYLAAVLASTPKWHVFLWDLEDADAAPVIHSGDRLPAALVVFSPDSRLLAFRTEAHNVTVWNLAEHQIETEIQLPTELNGSLGFSCDGKLLGIHGMEVDERQALGANARGVLVVWDVTEDQQYRQIDTGPWFAKAQVAFSSDGRRVAVAGVDGEIQVLDLEGKDPSITLHHGAAPQSLAWEPEGERLISAGIGSLNVWEFSEPPPHAIEQFEPDAFPGPMGPFSYSPDGRWVVVEKPFVRASGTKDRLQVGGLVVFERGTGKLVRTLQFDASAVYRLLFSQDGKKLVRLAFSGLMVWDLESGNEIACMKAGRGTGRELVSAGFRKDGNLLVAGHADFQPTVWEANTTDIVWQGSKQLDVATVAVVSPDARFVVEFEAYGKGGRNTTRVFDLSTSEERFQLDTPPAKDHQCRVTVSPDARRILTLCLEGPVTRGLQPWTGQQAWSLGPVVTWSGIVWDAETGERQLEMNGASTVATYAFSPDGRYLAIGEANGAVRLWSLEHREELFGWRAWGERVKAPQMHSHLAFTPDGSALSVADPSSSTLHVLQLTRVQSELAEIGLDW